MGIPNRGVIKEIFTSIQGEGPYVGVKQLFVRFCGCNLKCSYCDTDKRSFNATKYTADELAPEINKDKSVHSVAITGGEPLLQVDFLLELFPKLEIPIYLETNATMAQDLIKVIEYVDIVAADIKLPSASGTCTFNENEEFLKICVECKKNVFAKVVFDNKITDGEIKKTAYIANKLGILLVLQPVMHKNRPVTTAEFNELVFKKFNRHHNNVRLIPQTHKFLGLR